MGVFGSDEMLPEFTAAVSALEVGEMGGRVLPILQRMVKIDDEIEIKILQIDREKEKIALGLKQLKANCLRKACNAGVSTPASLDLLTTILFNP